MYEINYEYELKSNKQTFALNSAGNCQATGASYQKAITLQMLYASTCSTSTTLHHLRQRRLLQSQAFHKLTVLQRF